MDPKELGYSEYPLNSNGILRARTTMQVRSWHIQRKQKTLKALTRELDTVQYPGLYILFDKTKVYVGEAEHFPTRLSQHLNEPDDKIRDWSEALIISDGRPITQSIFNNKAVRLVLEAYLTKLFRANKYNVVSSARTPKLDQSQQHIVNILLPELNFFLAKKGTITRFLEESGQEQVYLDELIELFKKKRISIQKWGEKEATFEGKKVFIRPGSKKPKGWQITIRGRKAGSFIDCARRGDGYLLVPRDGVLFIPLAAIKKFIPESAFDLDTVDIFIGFTDEKVTLAYSKGILDVTQFRLLP